MFADKRKPAPDGTGSAISLISAQAHQQIRVPTCGSVLSAEAWTRRPTCFTGIAEASIERDRISQIKVELTRLYEEQVEFFRKRSVGELAPFEHHRYEKRRERIRQLFAELYGMRKVA